MQERFSNPDPDTIHALLARTHTIAVVGLSPRPTRPSYRVAEALQNYGYRIVPVRPATADVLGETAYPDLQTVPVPVDLVDVFRSPEHVDPIVNACIECEIPALWLQDGVINPAAALRARDAGILVIMNRCTFRDYARFASEGRPPRGAS